MIAVTAAELRAWDRYGDEGPTRVLVAEAAKTLDEMTAALMSCEWLLYRCSFAAQDVARVEALRVTLSKILTEMSPPPTEPNP